jgi:phosphonate transport system substrate-binding protein
MLAGVLVFLSLLIPVNTLAVELTVALLPRYSVELVNKRTNELAKYLSDQLGKEVKPIITSDSQEFKRRILSGEITIALEDPMMYVQVSDVHEAVATVIKNDMSKLRGVIVVRKDSPIEALQEIKGKTISIAGKESAAGYLSQKITLQDVELLPGRDYTVVTAVENKHENVILAVYTGDVDAGFVRRMSIKQVSRFIPIDKIRILAATAWLPHWALSVNANLPTILKDEIADAVIDLRSDSTVATSFKINGFQSASDYSYDPVREALEY